MADVIRDVVVRLGVEQSTARLETPQVAREAEKSAENVKKTVDKAFDVIATLKDKADETAKTLGDDIFKDVRESLDSFKKKVEETKPPLDDAKLKIRGVAEVLGILGIALAAQNIALSKWNQFWDDKATERAAERVRKLTHELSSLRDNLRESQEFIGPNIRAAGLDARALRIGSQPSVTDQDELKEFQEQQKQANRIEREAMQSALDDAQHAVDVQRRAFERFQVRQREVEDDTSISLIDRARGLGRLGFRGGARDIALTAITAATGGSVGAAQTAANRQQEAAEKFAAEDRTARTKEAMQAQMAALENLKEAQKSYGELQQRASELEFSFRERSIKQIQKQRQEIEGLIEDQERSVQTIEGVRTGTDIALFNQDPRDRRRLERALDKVRSGDELTRRDLELIAQAGPRGAALAQSLAQKQQLAKPLEQQQDFLFREIEESAKFDEQNLQAHKAALEQLNQAKAQATAEIVSLEQEQTNILMQQAENLRANTELLISLNEEMARIREQLTEAEGT